MKLWLNSDGKASGSGGFAPVGGQPAENSGKTNSVLAEAKAEHFAEKNLSSKVQSKVVYGDPRLDGIERRIERIRSILGVGLKNYTEEAVEYNKNNEHFETEPKVENSQELQSTVAEADAFEVCASSEKVDIPKVCVSSEKVIPTKTCDPKEKVIAPKAGVPSEEVVPTKRSKKKLSNQWIGFFFAIIPLLGFAIFSLVPAIISLLASFSTMTGYRLGSMQWVTPLFKNYVDAITDEYFFHSVGISFYITLNQIISLVIAIIIATFVSRKVKGSEFFSTVYFIPYICSGVAVAFMWSRLFHTEFGVINSLLLSIFGEEYPKLFGVEAIGGVYTNVNWLGTAHLFVPVLIVILVWSAAGYGIVILGAALVGVDKSLYEAAEIDGAGELKQFFKITLPQISPTVYFLLMLGLLNGLQTFDIVMIMVGDGWNGYGPDRMGQTLMLYIYKLGRNQNPNMPLSSAMSWLLFLLVFAIQRLNEFISRRWVHSE